MSKMEQSLIMKDEVIRYKPFKICLIPMYPMYTFVLYFVSGVSGYFIRKIKLSENVYYLYAGVNENRVNTS